MQAMPTRLVLPARRCHTAALHRRKLPQHAWRHRRGRLHTMPCWLGVPHRGDRSHIMQPRYHHSEYWRVYLQCVPSGVVSTGERHDGMQCVPHRQQVPRACVCANNLQPRHDCDSGRSERVLRVRSRHLSEQRWRGSMRCLPSWLVLPQRGKLSNTLCCRQLLCRHQSEERN